MGDDSFNFHQSNHDQHIEQPFGYDFFSYASAPPSNGLLNITDHGVLDRFFADPTAFDGGNIPADLTQQAGSNSPLDLTWLNGPPPPAFHSLETTLGHPQTSNGLPGAYLQTTESYLDTSTEGTGLSTSEDVIGAAAALFNHSQAAHSNPGALSFTENYRTPSHFPGQTAPHHMIGQVSNPSSSSLHRASVSASPFTNPGAPLIPQPFSHPSTIDDSFSTPYGYNPQAPRPGTLSTFRYGSDHNFSTTGYNPPECAEMREMKLISELDQIFVPEKSGQSTQQSSPVASKRPQPIHVPAKRESSASDDEDSDNDVYQQSPEKPKKRQKSRHEPTEDDPDPKPTHRPRSSGKTPQGSRPAKSRKLSQTESPSKRRKSSPTGNKAHRENLSEEQKRNNHILSEQKRRNLIKNGFEELHQLVPELRQGGFSKSNILLESANFLDELVRVNTEMKKALGILDKNG